MESDELKRDWQSQDGSDRIVIPADILLRELRRNERTFRAVVLWRDVREVGVSLVMVGFFLWCTAKGMGWPGVVVAAACLWIALFLTIDRLRQRRREASSGDSIRACAQSAIVELEHQIWLLRNLFWWYLAPPGGALLLSWVWMARRQLSWPLLVALGFVILVFAGAYWLNQRGVRRDLLPRKAELQALLESLQDSRHE